MVSKGGLFSEGLMKRALFLMCLALLLAGCLPDRERELAICQVEAMRLYPQERLNPPQQHNLHLSDFLKACMRAKGWRFHSSYKEENCVDMLRLGARFEDEARCLCIGRVVGAPVGVYG
jgi:hypothetical protein